MNKICSSDAQKIEPRVQSTSNLIFSIQTHTHVIRASSWWIFVLFLRKNIKKFLKRKYLGGDSCYQPTSYCDLILNLISCQEANINHFTVILTRPH